MPGCQERGRVGPRLGSAEPHRFPSQRDELKVGFYVDNWSRDQHGLPLLLLSLLFALLESQIHIIVIMFSCIDLSRNIFRRLLAICLGDGESTL